MITRYSVPSFAVCAAVIIPKMHSAHLSSSECPMLASLEDSQCVCTELTAGPEQDIWPNYHVANTLIRPGEQSTVDKSGKARGDERVSPSKAPVCLFWLVMLWLIKVWRYEACH